MTQILIGRPGTLVDRFAASGVHLVQVPSRSLTHPAIVNTVRQLADVIRKADAEIVHAHDVYANILAVPAARTARAPAIISSRRWWKATPRRVHRILNRISYAMSDATVANAQSVASMLVSDERLSRRKVHVIPNIIDESLLEPAAPTDRATIREELGISQDALAIMCVARLVPIKNHRMLLNAFSDALREVPELQLALVGGGELQQTLEDLAKELGIADKVIFAGERHGAARCFRAADIAVLTSFSEGMPNSLLEAMACGLPVISTAVGGAVDLVMPGETGILVTSDDVPGLSRAIVTLASDSNARRRYGVAGSEMIRSGHTAESVMSRTEEVYRQLLAER